MPTLTPVAYGPMLQIAAVDAPTSATTQSWPSIMDGITLLPESTFTDIHPALEQVRHLPEFQPPAPNWLDALQQHPLFQEVSKHIDRLLQQVTEALAHLLSRMALPGLAAEVPKHIQTVFNGILGFLGILIALYILYLVTGLILQGRKLRLPWQKSALSPEAERGFTSRQHWAQAQRFAQEGNYAEGIRQLYLAAIFKMDEDDWIVFEASRSNREYQTALSGLGHPDREPSLKTRFKDLSTAFEQVCYGHQKAKLAGFEQCKTAYDDLQRLLR